MLVDGELEQQPAQLVHLINIATRRTLVLTVIKILELVGNPKLVYRCC